MHTITLQPGKKVYFASDFHLGSPNEQISREREKKLVSWLEAIKADAQAIFLVGDVYDFWFEYKHVIPKGFIRFQGKLAELADAGVELYFFPGNHDLWMFGYYKKELGAVVSRAPMQVSINSRQFYIAHGDGLGKGDYLHKAILKIFESTFFQWLFSMFPTAFAYGIANYWSQQSRLSNDKHEPEFLGDNEFLWNYAKEVESHTHHDYYIFGHRHLVVDKSINANSRYINLGDWINHYTYFEFDGVNGVYKSGGA